jgi:hypothetical protein
MLWVSRHHLIFEWSPPASLTCGCLTQCFGYIAVTLVVNPFARANDDRMNVRMHASAAFSQLFALRSGLAVRLAGSFA